MNHAVFFTLLESIAILAHVRLSLDELVNAIGEMV